MSLVRVEMQPGHCTEIHTLACQSGAFFLRPAQEARKKMENYMRSGMGRGDRKKANGETSESRLHTFSWKITLLSYGRSHSILVVWLTGLCTCTSGTVVDTICLAPGMQ